VAQLMIIRVFGIHIYVMWILVWCHIV
jgi:hypothetical protein